MSGAVTLVGLFLLFPFPRKMSMEPDSLTRNTQKIIRYVTHEARQAVRLATVPIVAPRCLLFFNKPPSFPRAHLYLQRARGQLCHSSDCFEFEG